METPQILNTGELTDSLAITDELMVELIQRFARQRRHKLLLLTKSDNVENLLPLEHNNQTIVSFSLNIPEVIEQYEVGSPNLDRVAEAGYEVRVRIDPMIPVEGWSIAYRKLAEKLRCLTISRITLGTLRYFPIVAKYAVKLGRGIDVFNFATERTVDGRIRPIESLRRNMYLNIFTSFNCSVALCKETASVYAALKPSARCNCVL